MRQTLPFLTLPFFCSCGQQSEQKTSAQDKVVHSVDSIRKADDSKSNDKEQMTHNNDFLLWEKHEDSLRHEILKRKENNILKESFLQEMYIRNVVSVLKDSLFVSIPFNLHGPDCGAPDCYQTDVSFSFKLGDTLRFPKELQFQEHEHGCVDKEIKISGVFQLKEVSSNHVIYHSTKYNRTLVLFNTNKESGAYAFYFIQVGPDRINGKNVFKIMKDFNEEDKNSIYPYTSRVLSTSEYENFVH
jgi:hypothetical protein